MDRERLSDFDIETLSLLAFAATLTTHPPHKMLGPERLASMESLAERGYLCREDFNRFGSIQFTHGSKFTKELREKIIEHMMKTPSPSSKEREDG